MCGIFGYIGQKKHAADIILNGLKRLEYRGYDSWGVAVPSKSHVSVFKKVGAIGTVEGVDLPESNIAIGHTRWATHGGVSDINAHPHYSTDKSFVLAQNGIVENFDELKAKLIKKGYKFKTETDTEVIVRLIEDSIKARKMSLPDAVRYAFLDLKGRNTIILLSNDGQIIACRNGSPLVIGKSKGKGIYFSSDTHSFSDVCNEVLVVDNGQMVAGNGYDIELFDIKGGKSVDFKFGKIEFLAGEVQKEGFEHFMLKEIFESAEVIKVLTAQYAKVYLDFAKEIKKAKKVYTIGSGTAGVAAAQIAYFLRSIAKINAISLVGADASEYIDLVKRGDLIIAPSQSGETADVLEVLEILKKKGVKIASFVNMPGSMMTKMSDFPFMAGAGPEIAVVSTKVYTSQIAWGYLMANAVVGKFKKGANELEVVAFEIEKFLKDKKRTKNLKVLARKLSKKDDVFLLAKSQNFQIAREGMVKFIETSYKHAHAIPAGDLKHYAITLMQKGVPVIVLVSEDEVKSDVLNAASQVHARGSFVIGMSCVNNKDFDFWFKLSDLGSAGSIFNVVVLQLLAYYVGIEVGNNVDRPRNIAKSVTVK